MNWRMDPFQFLAVSLSITGATLSVLTTIYSFVEKRRLTAKAIREASEKEFEQALGSSDIVVLGNYLYSRIGSFNVEDYSSDEKVRKKVTQFLGRLDEFLGEEAEEPTQPPQELPQAMSPTGPPIPPELQKAQDELRNGRIWSSLVLLRNEIEKQLRTLASPIQNTNVKHVGAGSLLARLAKERMISEDALPNLRYAINVANRGVHGYEISENEAQDALRSAAIALSLLRQTKNN